MKIRSRYRAMALWKKIVLLTAAGLILHGITGFLILPAVIKSVSEKQLGKMLRRAVSIDSVCLNPYELSLTVRGLTVKDREGSHSLFSFDSIYFNLGSRSILTLTPVVEELTVVHPFFRLIRFKNGLFNISDLLPQSRTSPAQPQKGMEKGLSGFTLARLTVKDGQMEIQNQLIGATHLINNLTLDIPFISSMAKHGSTLVTPRFSAIIDDAPLGIMAETKPFSSALETAITLDLKNIDLDHYLSYLPAKTNIKRVGGVADLLLTLGFSKNDSPTPDLVMSGGLTIKDLSIETLAGETLLSLEKFETILAPSTPLTHTVHIQSIAVNGPTLHLARDEAGLLNINNLMAQGNGAETSNTAAIVEKKPPPDLTITIDQTSMTHAKVLVTDRFNTQAAPTAPLELATLDKIEFGRAVLDTKKQRINLEKIGATRGNFTLLRLADNRLTIDAFKSGKKAQVKKESPETTPWTAEIGDVAINDFSLTGRGLARPGKGNFVIDRLNLTMSNLSTLPGKKTTVDLDLRINTTGNIGVNGWLGLDPVAANLNLDLNDINLTWAQPFLIDHFIPMITNGKLMINGNIDVENPGSPNGRLQYKGKAAIMDLSLTEPLEGNKLIGWKKLALTGMDLDLSLNHASIDEVLVDRPLGRIVMDRDGRINLQNILKIPPGKEKKTDEKDEIKADKTDTTPRQVDLTIGRIVFTKGDLQFKDRSIEPEFKINLDSIDTTLKNFSLQESQKADFDFNARVNNHADIKINGRIHPLKDALFLDTQVVLNNMDLGPVSPYSGKYAGYTIQQGKLSMNLDYKIDQGKLAARNDIVLDLFDFGEPTQSDAAIKAPVKLALALLKDTRGKIELKLPVNGDLNDPEFSVGGVVLKMIMNLLAKAATSPFALLGSMFGDEENLDTIEFFPGSTEPTPQSLEKITILTRALQERPGLGLEITGYIDPEKDRQSIEGKRFNRILKTIERSRMIEQGEKTPPVDEIILSEEAFVTCLETAFATVSNGLKTTQKDRDEVDPQTENSPENKKVPKTVPDLAAMEKAVRASLIITDDDLGHLAHARSMAVADKIFAMGEIDTDRIFIKKPATLEPPPERGGSPASVLLKLR